MVAVTIQDVSIERKYRNVIRKEVIRMKKIFLMFLLLATLAFLPSCNNFTDYNLKTEDTKWLSDVSIKFMDSDYNSEVSWYITPAGFDYEKLNNKGYSMTITVSYDVYYVKDYDVLWDIGYMGAPKYEAYIINEQNIGVVKENLETTSTSVTRTITYQSDIVNLMNEKIRLVLSTDNIQNIVCFKNIKVAYKCYK